MGRRGLSRRGGWHIWVSLFQAPPCLTQTSIGSWAGQRGVEVRMQPLLMLVKKSRIQCTTIQPESKGTCKARMVKAIQRPSFGCFIALWFLRVEDRRGARFECCLYAAVALAEARSAEGRTVWVTAPIARRGGPAVRPLVGSCRGTRWGALDFRGGVDGTLGFRDSKTRQISRNSPVLVEGTRGQKTECSHRRDPR